MSNIEFSSVGITKALHEAVKGAAELRDQSEEDFIHQVLAFFVGQTMLNKSEIIILQGETVEEDFRLLKRAWKLGKEGKRVITRWGGNKGQWRIISKAHEKMADWLEQRGEEEAKVNGQEDDPFGLLWKNIKHEKQWALMKQEKSLDMMKGKITLDEYESFEAKEGAEYRTTRGYLASEIPIVFIPSPQMMIPPEEIDRVLEIVKVVEDGNLSSLSLEDILYLVAGKGVFNQIRKILKKRLGKKKLDEFDQAITLRLKAMLDHVTKIIKP